MGSTRPPDVGDSPAFALSEGDVEQLATDLVAYHAECQNPDYDPLAALTDWGWREAAAQR